MVEKINKNKILEQIKIKLNLFLNSNENIYMIDFNLDIGKLLTLQNQKVINEELSNKLIRNLKQILKEPENEDLITETIKIMSHI